MDLQLPDAFKLSYEQFELYPRKPVYRPLSSYPAALKTYSEELAAASPTLFESNENVVLVRFWELVGQTWAKFKVLSDDDLRNRLGTQSANDPAIIAPRKDPKCRFVDFSAGNSPSRLMVTKKMFLRILAHHQVMPEFLDFTTAFGTPSEFRDLQFSAFYEQIAIHIPARHLEMNNIGRSGRQYQLCYNLIGVSSADSRSPSRNNTMKRDFFVRQAAFCHVFDFEEGTSLWITMKGDLELRDRVEKTTGAKGRPEDRDFDTPRSAFKANLAIHRLHGFWSTERWKNYVRWLKVEVEDMTHLAIHGPRGREDQHTYTPKYLQYVLYLQDQINEVVMFLEANADGLTSVARFYHDLIQNPKFDLRNECRQDVATFSTEIDSMVKIFRREIPRARNVALKIESGKTAILDHLSAQATQKVEVLSVSMHEIGAQSQREAIAMRLITVVTLIYLPATFVSTFFSTDIVKYQGQDGGSSFSNIAMQRWIEVTVPLTFVTVGFAWLFYKRSEKYNKNTFDLLPFWSQSKTSL